MTTNNISAYAEDLNNWIKFSDFAKEFATEDSKFTYPQIKRLFIERNSGKYPDLNRCYRLVGKTGYVNKPLFGLWMAGLLDGAQA